MSKKGNLYETYVKRGIDVALSGVGGVLLLPVYAGIAVAIVIDDPGPVLFTQKRVGKGKEFFQLHKFRSMKMSTPHDVPTHQMENPDQYITRVGRVLRKYSLDELPQIWDIFTGKMSVIGPRPALWNQDDLVAERDKYGANDVTPGLTGWAQINGRDEIEIPLKAKLDGDYTRELHKNSVRGFVMDARCFFGTIVSVMHHEGVVEGGTGQLAKEAKKHSQTLSVDDTKKKHVLITGAGSYIGESFLASVKEREPDWQVESLDLLDPSWEEVSFKGFDHVIHVAGLAHQKETAENAWQYYEVNERLAVRVAEKAKKDGVSRFIFMSSMSVYGLEEGIVRKDTVPDPKTNYGRSKLLAEKGIKLLADDGFKLCIVRPPMVYGKGCRGNFQTVRKLASMSPVFPKIKNRRSMIHIDNLCGFLRLAVEKDLAGVYFPQNRKYMNTTRMAEWIAEAKGRKMYSSILAGIIVNVMRPKLGIARKAFGTLVYKDMEEFDYSYCVVGNETSVKRSAE